MEKEILEILKSMQNDIQAIKSTKQEHTQQLKSLAHKTEVITAEQENLKHQFARIKGEVKSIRKDFNSTIL